MRKRGINEFDEVQIDYWAVGQVAPQYQGRRLLRAVSYFKGDSTNFYGRPIEGVGVLVDMNAEKVVEFVDTGRRAAPAAEPGAGREIDWSARGAEAARPSRSPTARASRSPARRFAGRSGASATRCTRAKAWCSTRSATRTRDGCGRSSTARRSRRWPCRTAIPTGTGAGAARSTSASTAWAVWPARSSRTPTRRSNATLIDVTFAGDNGEPYVLPRAVGIYERDGGMLWKHYEIVLEDATSRAARGNW